MAGRTDKYVFGVGGVVADKIPWCKFWTSCLSDPDLEELELHQWARWARLIVFLRGHGENGKMRIEPPARALQNCLRVQSYGDLIAVIKLFKNVTLTPLLHPPLGVTDKEPLHEPLHETKQSYFVSCKNWYKYQGESSKERVRKWRQKNTVTKSVSSNALDKSRLDVTSTSTTKAASRDASLASAPAPQTPGKIKSFDEAGPDDLCGPPPNLLEQFRKKVK